MGMMDWMWNGYRGYTYGFPFFGWGMMLVWLIVFLVIAFLVYQDANSRGMNGLLWGILVLIPMAGILFLILYIVIRESGTHKPVTIEKTATDILKERYAKGEISGEQYNRMLEDLKK